MTPLDLPDLDLPDLDLPDFDLDDAALRRAGSVKWTFGGPDVLPAWVAELDVAPCPPVAAALHDAIDRGMLGYPALDSVNGLPEATASFVRDRFGWNVDPALVISTGDVMAGVILLLQRLCGPGDVIVPVPAYPPFLAAVPLTGHQLIPVPMLEPDQAGQGYRLDLDRIDAELSQNATTILLANPCNPVGRVFSRTELEALRDVVVRHGARVISDEIHAPLVYDNQAHIPYATLDGTADHVTTLVAASKAWNLPGLKCAQIVFGNTADRNTIRGLHHVVNHGVSPLGVTATIAAYAHGRPWLDGLIAHLQARRDQLGSLLAEHLPQISWTPPEATYLAWLDTRSLGSPGSLGSIGSPGSLGLSDPAELALQRSKVLVQSGALFGDGYDGFVRVNFGTSAERLERVVKGLASAWS